MIPLLKRSCAKCPLQNSQERTHVCKTFSPLFTLMRDYCRTRLGIIVREKATSAIGNDGLTAQLSGLVWSAAPGGLFVL